MRNVPLDTISCYHIESGRKSHLIGGNVRWTLPKYNQMSSKTQNVEFVT
jgi:hypothetical protein